MPVDAGGDRYVVTIAKYGTRSGLRSEVYLNYSTYQQPDAPVRMDYFVWVARNAERTIVIDTGFSRHGGDVRDRQTVTDVAEIFERLGIDPADAPTVVITHAHFDHIGNLPCFPDSRVVLSRREYDFWTGPHAGHPLFHHSVEDAELAYLRHLVERGMVDFFSTRTRVAPGVEVIELGGHTPGQSVVTVNTSEGVVLLASDAIHYYEEYEAEMPFVSVTDVLGMYEAFATIREMIASGEATHLVSGHDPSTLARFAPAPGELGEFASTIGSLDDEGGDR